MSSPAEDALQKSEEARRASEARFRLMFESIEDYAIILFDPGGLITHWNPGAERLFGYRTDEVLGWHFSALFTPEDRKHHLPEQVIERAKTEGKAVDDRWLLRKDQSRLWVMGMMIVVRDEQGHLCGYVKILRDVTERKEAEEERQRQSERLAEQTRQTAILEERNRLAREMHDTLAQGFTGIMMQLEVVAALLPESARQAREHLALAHDLARDSLAEARRSVQALRPTTLEQADLAAALARLAEETTAATPVNVTLHIQGARRPLPDEMERQLFRIGQEALTNALRHAQATRMDIDLEFRTNQVRLRIWDNGKGFEVEKAASGSTLGLLGMRERAVQAGGELGIESHPGRGTTVTVRAPIPADSIKEE